jgi:predicted N-acetyltransferase YhbS
MDTFGPVEVGLADTADATAIALLRSAAASSLTAVHGPGHWSAAVTAGGVLRGIATSRVLVARRDGHVLGTLRLTTRRPWAIDPQFFSRSRRTLYLVDMAVDPPRQYQGIGRALIAAAKADARDSQADAIRLDAYDGPMGAGPFYAKCGFREVGRVTYRTVPLRYFEWLPDA